MSVRVGASRRTTPDLRCYTCAKGFSGDDLHYFICRSGSVARSSVDLCSLLSVSNLLASTLTFASAGSSPCVSDPRRFSASARAANLESRSLIESHLIASATVRVPRD